MNTVFEAKCNSCGHQYPDAQELQRASLDAFAGPDDYDLFCAYCDSDDIVLYNVDTVSKIC